MSATTEPLAAILAEFRKFALRAAEEDKMISPESVLLLADKVEAAAAQERVSLQGTIDKMRRAISENTPGNAAAMRAALEAIDEATNVIDRSDLWEARAECLDDALYNIREKARAAIGKDASP